MSPWSHKRQPFRTSLARTLLNTKYDLGETRAHDTSFVGYILVALHPLSRKETTHSSSSYDDKAIASRRPRKKHHRREEI